MRDLQLRDNDLALEKNSLEPVLLKDAAVIAQDIRVRLLVSGALHQLIGETPREDDTQRLILEIEKDLRIEPGSVQIQYLRQKISIRARLLEGGTIEL